MQCKGQTKKGKRCVRSVADGHFCFQHGAMEEPDDPVEALTDKQRRFVEEYVIDFNQTRAAERAGYTGNEGALAVTGHRLVSDAKVREALRVRFDQMAMPSEEVVERITDIARSSVSPFTVVRIDDKGRPYFDIDMTTPEAQAALRNVKKLKFDNHGRPQIEMYSSLDALDKLAKIRNLYRERLDISIVDKRADELRDKSDDLEDVSDEELAAMTEVFTDT